MTTRNRKPTKHQPRRMVEQDMATQIKTIARRQMAEQGTAGISLRAIARELDVTAPAIYNYYRRLDDLITALIADAFTALADAMQAAADGVTSKKSVDRVLAIVHAYRAWAIQNPIDFQLIYGNPIPGYVAPFEITAPLARRPFLGLFQLFLQAYERGELVIPNEYVNVPPHVASFLAEWKRANQMQMPDALVCLLMSGWARIHGMVMLELTHHATGLIGDTAEFYTYEMNAFAQRLGFKIK
jgi:AcrR family transcriptional regulator